MKITIENSLLLNSISRIITLFILVFGVYSTSTATVYTSISDGSYNDCTIWDNGCPNNNIQENDTVIINHVVTANSSMNVQGTLILGVNGSFSNSNTIEITLVGVVVNQGDFVTDNPLNINGTFYNEATITAPSVYSNGYLCNSGTVEVQNDFFCDGGLLDCGGTLLTCEINMDSNAGAIDVTGSATSEIYNQDVCCSDPTMPNPFSDLQGDFYIDSASVYICSLGLEVDAGDDVTTNTCNGVGALIDLYSLLSEDVDAGTFSETVPTGAFDAATGIFNTEGLTPGTYTFIYTTVGYNSDTDESVIEVTVYPVLYSTSDLVACASDLPIEWNGMSIATEGTHSVTLTSLSTGCDSIASVDLTIEFLDAPDLFTSGPVQCSGDVVELSAEEITNAEYTWFGPNGFESQDLSSVFELTHENEGQYGVYYSLNSCVSETAFIDLNIEDPFVLEEFKFPNVITANEDGVNDFIDIDTYVGACEEFTFTVRDRWGIVVFEQQRGEGAFEGKDILGQKLPDGVYFYSFSYGDEVVKDFLHIVY